MPNDREGVIKYRLDHQYRTLPSDADLCEINAWRAIIFRLGLIGRIADKYDGLGFGNISIRRAPGQNGFLVSATQTGHLPQLGREHYAWVTAASPQQNHLQAQGPAQPSSEALTHAVIYQRLPNVQAVIHGHCPELWHNTAKLRLAHTAAHIPYGTPEMASAVASLLEATANNDSGIFTMLGHEDGVVAFGTSLKQAAEALIGRLAQALALEQNRPAR
ncbi:class II aldolase/adducin family protein [Methylomonas sp. SURF-1]|uniref:Class II aldolase/adducin family protein n=1 Tax=Methylomonas aurea TaxID=2952224 RepID=A0ABT1UKY6_9GAMM|nr:class II aldolase/adducin family protein [Methylomonas sp. SURF-1]MCQ8182374.1 class II aldolase/adducin family protein [Methylomonas sp. SURF-1]